MIAPPHYKCEVVTHNKIEGEAKLKQALAVIKRVIKANGGAFKQESGPEVIGANSNETDVSELMAQAAQDNGEDDSGEESYEEGMGDVDLNANVEVEDDEDEEEEKKA